MDKKYFDYINQYQKEHYERITILTSKEIKEEVKKAAAFKGVTASVFIVDCIKKELERMKE